MSIEREPNHLLAAVMMEAGVSNKGLAARVRTLAQRDGHSISADHVSVRRWLDGALPRGRTPDYVALALSAKLQRRVTPADLGMTRVPDKVTIDLARSSESIDQQAETFIAAAHESAQDAVLRAAHTSDALTIMRRQMIATAQRYSYRAPISIFADARHVRNLAYQIADRTRRPSELADLYVLAGTANALMASIAFDIGHWDAARSLAESATVYANLAGHASLEAWTWGLQATLANWRRDLTYALDCFERGLTVAPRGSPRLRLRHIVARTHAGLGNTRAAAGALAEARADQEVMASRRDELQDEVRGEFEFSEARAAACAAAAWLELREVDRAEEYAHMALDRYSELSEETRPFSPVNGIRIDIASARLLGRDLDGATDSLRPVLDLYPGMRNAALIGRLDSGHAILLVGGHRISRFADS